MVKAGEHGGLLAEILDRLAGFLEASARLRKKVKSAMTYPVIVICIAFAITTFLIVKVVPIFGEIFKDFGAKLPAPTQFLIDVSEFMRGDWYFLIGGIGGVFFGIRTFLRSKRGKQLWDRWKLKLPIFGPLVHKICMSRFSRTFAQLIRSGVPILEVHRHRRRRLRQPRGRDEHQRRGRRRGERRQSFRRSFEEANFPADAAPHGRRPAKRPARSTPCSRRWPTSGTKKSRPCSMRSPH